MLGVDPTNLALEITSLATSDRLQIDLMWASPMGDCALTIQPIYLTFTAFEGYCQALQNVHCILWAPLLAPWVRKCGPNAKLVKIGATVVLTKQLQLCCLKCTTLQRKLSPFWYVCDFCGRREIMRHSIMAQYNWWQFDNATVSLLLLRFAR